MTSFRSIIKSIRDETKNVKTFVLSKPDDFTFIPGQYCWLSLPEYDPSPMAIASGTQDNDLEFTIRLWGDLTEALFELQPGATVEVDGPHGTAFPSNQVSNETPLYMVAGGTGITPIRSLTRSLGTMGEKLVLYGAKRPKELLYYDEIQSWPAKVQLTVDHDDGTWQGHTGLVTILLDAVDLDTAGLCFICGPTAMEESVVEYLRTLGFDEDRIFVSLERFDEEGNVVGPVLPVSDPEVEF